MSKPITVYIGIGSNINREHNIRHGLFSLRTYYDDLVLSSVYRSQSIGYSGADFFNLVAQFKSCCNPSEIQAHLHDIESQCGRQRSKQSTRCALDIDLLLYGTLVSKRHRLPRSDILKYAFVLKPLAELAPDLIHPVNGMTMSELWVRFAPLSQQLSLAAESFTL